MGHNGVPPAIHPQMATMAFDRPLWTRQNSLRQRARAKNHFRFRRVTGLAKTAGESGAEITKLLSARCSHRVAPFARRYLYMKQMSD